MSFQEEMKASADVNRRLAALKQKKKQATQDGQLLINRIALLQKEEERARKKIAETTEKATDVLQMREKNVHRLRQWDKLTNQDLKKKKEMQSKFKRDEEQAKETRYLKAQSLHEKRWKIAGEVKSEREKILKAVMEDQERDLEQKQKKREEIRAQQEQARLRRERERIENERKVREYHEKMLEAEAEEAHRAELLVKELEKKEQEWIHRLRNTQAIQESAFEHLEAALMLDDTAASSPFVKRSSTTGKERSPSAPPLRISSAASDRRRITAGK